MELNRQEIADRNKISVEEVDQLINQAKQSMIPLGKQIDVVENGTMRWFIVTRRGVGIIKTDYGQFHQFDFQIDDQWEKYSVIFRGKLDDKLMPIFSMPELLLIRTDSGCETGQVFGDRTCECREQLQLALKTVANRGEGMVVNIPHQDGRGMGLPFKLATLRLQVQLKLNTVEAAYAIAPNGVIELRTYSGVIGVLKYFGVPETTKINLATNNPHKAKIFMENGYSVVDYTAIRIEPTEHTEVHLQAKQEHLGHLGLIDNPKEGDQYEDTTGAPPTAGSDDTE
jgi:3,4-dihydroxy 2-butanone 4-phosphate synthase/GTP cyclohydrolase II